MYGLRGCSTSDTPVAMKLPPTRSGRCAVALGGKGDPETREKLTPACSKTPPSASTRGLPPPPAGRVQASSSKVALPSMASMAAQIRSCRPRRNDSARVACSDMGASILSGIDETELSKTPGVALCDTPPRGADSSGNARGHAVVADQRGPSHARVDPHQVSGLHQHAQYVPPIERQVLFCPDGRGIEAEATSKVHATRQVVATGDQADWRQVGTGAVPEQLAGVAKVLERVDRH